MEANEAKEYIGKNCCIHWKDDEGAEAGMSGVITEVGPLPHAPQCSEHIDHYWVSVDWGYATRIEYIYLIHPAGEVCPDTEKTE